MRDDGDEVKDPESTTAAARGEFLTARQLAEILQVSESTVRRLAREGRIPAVRVTARLLRFRLEAVLQALDDTRPRTKSRRRPAHDGADESQLTFSDMF